MTEQEARERIVKMNPNFETYSDIIKDVAIAGFIAGYDRGYYEGRLNGIDVAGKIAASVINPKP